MDDPAARPPAAELVAPAAGPRPARSVPAAPPGLKPLPPPAQVARALPIGRFDPFAGLGDPLASPSPTPPSLLRSGSPSPAPPRSGPRAATAPAAGSLCPGLPADFRFTGVIRGGGQAYAVVEADGISGSLRVGDRGGSRADRGTTDLLPPCWSVARVDVNRGLLVLQQGRRRQLIPL
ncbi:MAG: hypothetical protein VKN13_08685 [Cyanobacteriota bacterium]|nr:hypothetical protein [Cyanobacteriota bacterium]